MVLALPEFHKIVSLNGNKASTVTDTWIAFPSKISFLAKYYELAPSSKYFFLLF